MGILQKIFGKTKSAHGNETNLQESNSKGIKKYQILKESLVTLVKDPNHDFQINVQCGQGLRSVDTELCSGKVSEGSVQSYSEELVPLLLDILNKESLRADFHDQIVNTLSNLVANANKMGIQWDKSRVESVLFNKLKSINEYVGKEPLVMAINCQHTAWVIPMILKYLDNLSLDTIKELQRLSNYPGGNEPKFEDVRQGANTVLKKFGKG